MILRFTFSLLAGGIAVLLAFGTGGCGVTATDQPGVFVPTLVGTYDLLAVTDFCEPLGIFDSVTDVVQSKGAFVLRANHSGVEDYTGTVDKDGVITLTGAGTDCKGNFIDGVLAATCDITTTVCAPDANGVETCTNRTSSCSVSYERR